MTKTDSQLGMTLIELIISLAISGMLLAAMVLAFHGQSTSYNSQQEITALQEDMWATLQLISRDIRMAGYDPKSTGAAKILVAQPTVFQATQDLNGNGHTNNPAADPDPNEDVTYSLVGNTINRTVNGAITQPVMTNITHLGFEYGMISNAGATTPYVWTWSDFSVTPATAPELAQINVVRICIQGRTAHPTSIKSEQTSFKPAFVSISPVWKPPSDYYQYRTMCIEAKCRNLQN